MSLGGETGGTLQADHFILPRDGAAEVFRSDGFPLFRRKLNGRNPLPRTIGRTEQSIFVGYKFGKIPTAVADAGLAEFAERRNVGVVPVSAKIEMEIASLSPEDALAFLKDLGIEESALTRVIRTSYELLGLISFFTAGEDECRAWTIRRGTVAPEGGGHDPLRHRARLHPRGGRPPTRPSSRWGRGTSRS